MSTTVDPPDRVEIDLLAEGTVSVTEAVRFSGVPRSSLYEQMNRGELPYTKVGKRRLIPRRALVEFLRRGLTSAEK